MARIRRLDLGRIAIVVLLVIGTAALLTRNQWDWLLEDGSVQSDGVTAPTIDEVDDATERLYRIGEGSSVTYTVEERLGGSSRRASGTTPAVAGDIAVNIVDSSASRVGTIVVNVEMFDSDSNLRDKRIRLDFLESREYPFATFEPTEVQGLPDRIVDGESHTLTISGDLSVKETTAPATFTGEATIDADTLRATMSGTVVMSAYDVGPINIAGLVHTSDEVELTFDLVAGRVDPTTPAVDVDDFVAPALEIGDGDFSTSVMPIIEQKCAACHGEGGPGRSTIALDTAGDAAAIADDIALVTGAGYMPPWLAGDLSIDFRHDWSLSTDEITKIASWAGGGGGLDVPVDTPLVADPDQLRSVDIDIRARTSPYNGSTEQVNDYRCRAVEVGNPSEQRWIQALQLEPDHLEVTHHALIFTASESARDAVARAELADREEGWACFGLAGLPGAQLVAAWAPGTQPFELPADAGLPLAPGDFVVVQIHYHFEDSAPPDAPTVVFDLASEADIAAAGGSLRDLRYEIYLAPAEIPCTDAQTGPLCDRAAVLRDISDNYGTFAAAIPTGLLIQCGQSLGAFLEDTDGVASASCDLPVVNPGEVVVLWAHMHEFGAEYRMTLNPDTPDERILLDIPTWSFEWQLIYTPEETLALEPGDVLRVECTWDRSLVHQPEPRYITWNEGTEDEMCFTSVATLPVRQ